MTSALRTLAALATLALPALSQPPGFPSPNTTGTGTVTVCGGTVDVALDMHAPPLDFTLCYLDDGGDGGWINLPGIWYGNDDTLFEAAVSTSSPPAVGTTLNFYLVTFRANGQDSAALISATVQSCS